MSSDSYQPFAFDVPTAPPRSASVTTSPAVSPPRHRTVTAPDGFGDWGKGADFRQFQRERAESVTSVTAFSGSLPWADGLDALHRMPKPRFLTVDRWEELLFDAVRFSRDWSEAAERHGWTVLELFGCHRKPEGRRLDNNGLIITLKGRSVTALDDTAATIDAGRGDLHRFRKGKLLLTSVPLWVAFASESGP